MASQAVAEAAHVVKITLVKCGLHRPPSIRNTLSALGLKKLHQTVYHKNIRPIRGMIYEVRNYVDVEPMTKSKIDELKTKYLTSVQAATPETAPEQQEQKQ